MDTLKKTLKKIGIFFLLFIALMGAVSAPVALGMYHSWIPMIGSLVVDLLAVHPYISLIKELFNE